MDPLLTTSPILDEIGGVHSKSNSRRSDTDLLLRRRSRSKSPIGHLRRRSASFSGHAQLAPSCRRPPPLKGRDKTLSCSNSPSALAAVAARSVASLCNAGSHTAPSIRRSPTPSARRWPLSLSQSRRRTPPVSRPACTRLSPPRQKNMTFTSPSDSNDLDPRSRLGLKPATMWCTRRQGFEDMRNGESVNNFLARKKGFLVDATYQPKPSPSSRMASAALEYQPAALIRPKQVSRD